MRALLGDTGWTRARAIASLGMVCGLGAVGTMAAWSDTATASTGMFQVSSVNVQLRLNSQHPTYAFNSLNKTNMARGASTASMLPVNNTGDTDFKYTLTVASKNSGTASYGNASAESFASNLTVEVFAGGTSDGTTCTGGTSIASKNLEVGSVDLISTARQLNQSNTENLCFRLTVSPNAPVAARMSALSVDFQFAATQA